jgi:hypothetical protein
VSAFAAVRARIEQRFPDATPILRRTAPAVASGIAELDRALPHGGFPLGKLSMCTPNGGITAILRAACHAAIAAGDRSVWIDGARTIAGAFWDEGPLLVRPSCHTHAVRAADELLRSGGFRLVVLTGAEPADAETMRLVRAVHDGGGAFAIVTPHAHMAGLRLASHIAEYQWKFDPFGDPASVENVRVGVDVRSLGWTRHADFSLSVKSHELRLSLESGLADRRGRVARPRDNVAHASTTGTRGRGGKRRGRAEGAGDLG